MQQQPDPLSPEKLQLFAAALSGLAPEEIRKAKVLYLRNAVAEYEAMQTSMAAFGNLQGCMSVIPVFWPMMGAQKKMIAAQLSLAKSRIRNAVDVWRSDIKGERFVVDGEEIVA
jgi:hypothetical protein